MPSCRPSIYDFAQSPAEDLCSVAPSPARVMRRPPSILTSGSRPPSSTCPCSTTSPPSSSHKEAKHDYRAVPVKSKSKNRSLLKWLFLLLVFIFILMLIWHLTRRPDNNYHTSSGTATATKGTQSRVVSSGPDRYFSRPLDDVPLHYVSPIATASSPRTETLTRIIAASAPVSKSVPHKETSARPCDDRDHRKVIERLKAALQREPSGRKGQSMLEAILEKSESLSHSSSDEN